MKRRAPKPYVNKPFKKPRQSSLVNPYVPARNIAEKKNIDVTALQSLSSGISLPNASTWSTPILLNGVGGGTTGTKRNGRKILMKSIFIRWSYAMGNSSTGGSPIRCLVIFDKQTNGAAPNVTDIVQIDDFHAPMNLGNSHRFMIISDSVTEPISKEGEFSRGGTTYRKLNIETMFNDISVTDVTGIESGSVFILFAQNGNISVASPGVNFYTRVRFIDN